MTHPETVTVPPSFLRRLRILLVSNLLLIAGIFGIAVGLVGVGSWTVVACVVSVAVTTILYILAALRQRPRVVITPEGFVFEKLFGRETHRWEEIDGRFVVIKIGWNQAVGYNLTPEYKARTGRKASSLFSGYDTAIIGGALPCSAGKLVELLNEHKQRYGGSNIPASPGGIAAEQSAADVTMTVNQRLPNDGPA
jgi:hypothetical protein